MSSLTQTRIAFLLGSGTSIPAGIPSTQVITKQILSGEGVMRHSNENYSFDEPLYGPRSTIQIIIGASPNLRIKRNSLSPN